MIVLRLLRAHYLLLIGLIGLLALNSCKAKKALVSGTVDSSLPARKIIQNHYANALDFDTMSGKLKVDYTDGDKNQGVAVSLRIKKDEAILVSAPLGFFKAYITPNRVSFYNKLEEEYFDGDFEYLTEFLGYPMDFNMVQNLFLGNTVLDLREQKYTALPHAEAYALKPKQEQALFKILFLLEPKHFRVQKQTLSQAAEGRMLSMAYNYQELADKIVPSTLQIEAVTTDGQRSIALDFRNIEFDRKLNFPYKIPKGYKAIASK